MPLVSSQVLSEYMNVLKRQFKLSKEDIMAICIANFDGLPFHSVRFETIKLAKTLIGKYDFQLFDSVVVASALESNCCILYSEDMHDGLMVEKRLKIVNPFFNH